MKKLLLVGSLVASSPFACVCTREDGHGKGSGADAIVTAANGFTLAKDQATTDLTEYTKAAHPFGSERMAAITTYFEGRVQASGATAAREAFTADVPNPAALAATGPISPTQSRSGVNLYALGATGTAAPCVVALASHYDTKEIEGLDYRGANDGGSSSVVLLHQIAYLKGQDAAKLGLTCDVVGVWFDGEEAVLFDWTDGQTKHPAHIEDNTYGSRHAAGRLTDCQYEGHTVKCLPADLGGKPLVAFVLMDMIGSNGIRISRDALSAQPLVALASDGAKALGMPDLYDAYAHGIEDDHIPYRKLGVQALDLIDFNNLDYWHAAGDEQANVSLDSMEKAGRLALYVALAVAKEPAKYLP